jgi:hypothetical protein
MRLERARQAQALERAGRLLDELAGKEQHITQYRDAVPYVLVQLDLVTIKTDKAFRHRAERPWRLRGATSRSVFSPSRSRARGFVPAHVEQSVK